ncbi:MAG: hypothetical protein RLZ98_1887 [Pseudomonadota bacterium]|jgi:ribonuclease D
MQLITTTQLLEEACARLARHPFVAIDTEFLREQTYWPELCLLQMAGPGEGDAFIVDPLSEGIDLAPFYSLMCDEQVVKVFHAGRQDIEIVLVRSGRVPTPIFDTQVAAMVCGFGESVSYVNLVKHVTGAQLDKSSRFTDWRRRPLSQKQLTYAIGDVTHLRDLYLYLQEQLSSSNRESWVSEEMADLTNPETYILAPENAWRRLKARVRSKKAFGALISLAAWRERNAQALDVPRSRVLRDEALYDIANQMPTDAQKLGTLRTLSDGFARSAKAKEIIEVVKEGLAANPADLPPLPSSQPLTADATALLDLLRVLLKSAAARSRVAPKLIASTDDLEALARGDDVEELPMLRGWRRQVFGEDALRMARGEIALTVRSGQVECIETLKNSD